MVYKMIKRTMDIIISILGLVILFPFLAIVAVFIKLETKGPILFKQNRLGLNGSVFTMYKFRSMFVDAEAHGSGQYSFPGDTRVTRIGKFIRATSIDELPQFINIIKGDMSIIGPRPPLTYHPFSYEMYNERQRIRFNIRPGVTGWAQINGRKDILWEKRFEYDIEYIKNLSLFFDLKILFKTILKVVKMQDNININKTVIKENETENTNDSRN